MKRTLVLILSLCLLAALLTGCSGGKLSDSMKSALASSPYNSDDEASLAAVINAINDKALSSGSESSDRLYSLSERIVFDKSPDDEADTDEKLNGALGMIFENVRELYGRNGGDYYPVAAYNESELTILEFDGVSDAYSYAAKETGLSADIISSLVWFSDYLNAGGAPLDSETLRTFIQSPDDNSGKSEFCKQLYLSALSHEAQTISYPISDEIDDIYDKYVALDCEGFEEAAIKRIQENPSSYSAEAIISLLVDRGRASEITARTVANSGGSGEDTFDPLKFALAADKVCFEALGSEEMYDECLALLDEMSFGEQYRDFCSRFSSLSDFASDNKSLMRILSKSLSSSAGSDAFELYDKGVSDAFYKRLYVPDQPVFEPESIYWTHEMLTEYVGSDYFTASNPQADKYIVVLEDLAESYSVSDLLTHLDSMSRTYDPNMAKTALYYKESFSYAGEFNTTTDATYRSTYSSSITFEAYDLVTGKSLGSVTLRNSPYVGSGDFYSEMNENGVYCYYMYLPDPTEADEASLLNLASKMIAVKP